MFVISTRSFPPDIGGMQNLMEGLAQALVSHGPVKVFADSFNGSEKYDKNSNIDINRVSGFKIFRKYRKANLIHDYAKNNNIRSIFFDHWKSLENLNDNIFKVLLHFTLRANQKIKNNIRTTISC